jgi:hypothetical protein
VDAHDLSIDSHWLLKLSGAQKSGNEVPLSCHEKEE